MRSGDKMSLKIFIRREVPDSIDTVKDVESFFINVKLHNTEKEKSILKTIEEAEYIDSISFKDKFGYKLPISALSTGTKAALCILNYPNEIVDLRECGRNAIDAIFSFCSDGNILIEQPMIDIVDYDEDTPKEIDIDGYRFKSISRLNRYFLDERPFKPDDMEDIQCLN